MEVTVICCRQTGCHVFPNKSLHSHERCQQDPINPNTQYAQPLWWLLTRHGCLIPSNVVTCCRLQPTQDSALLLLCVWVYNIREATILYHSFNQWIFSWDFFTLVTLALLIWIKGSFLKQKEMVLACAWIWPISTRSGRWQGARVSVFVCKVNDAVRPLEPCPEWRSQIFINIEVKMELITHWSIGLWKPHWQ